MIIVGITGCIGCGKTFLGKIIKSLGYSVYNPDDWTRELYKKMFFLNIIKENFPTVFENEIFNKRKLRELVFNDGQQLNKLENIIYPILLEKFKKIIRKHAKKEDIIFFDVALLLEFGWDKFCDYIITAHASENVQKQRVILRDGIKDADFYKIIEKQISQKQKEEAADLVINTENKENLLKVELIKFIKEILE